MSPSGPDQLAGDAAASVALGLVPASLSVSPGQVHRYAGGSRYQPDGTSGGLAREAIATAGRLITPALVYAVHPVASQSPPGALKLSNGQGLSLPPPDPNLQAKSLAVIVCTLGPGLEEFCRQLSRDGKVIEALFLDAAGTALLEDLGAQAFNIMREGVQAHRLFPVCRFAPGNDTLPLAAQSLLFRLVDAGAIGVQLNRHLVMVPSKSLSFFVTLSNERSAAGNTDKCGVCAVNDCRFRLLPEGPSGDRGSQSS